MVTHSSCRKRQQILRRAVANPLLLRLTARSFRLYTDLFIFHLLQWRDIANLDDFWCSLSNKDMPVDFPHPVVYDCPKGSADWKRAYERRLTVNRRWDQANFKVR